MKVSVTMKIEIPKVPNFFKTGDGQSVPICAVPDAELVRIAEIWKADLLKRAAQMHQQVYGKKREVGS